MHDQPVPDRLSQLRFLERVQTADLDRTRSWIADEERRQQEQQRGEQARPPAPDWLIAYSLGGRHPIDVHTGDCRMAGKHARPASRQAALRALTEGLPACTMCRPDTELGVLD